MPPSQQGTRFKEDIAKAFIDLDISKRKPLTLSKTPNSCDRNRLTDSKSPANTTKGDNKVTLLTFPVELRLRIWELLLIKADPVILRLKPLSAYRNANQMLVLLRKRMGPGILQTRKQNYHEAKPILYSQLVFKFSTRVQATGGKYVNNDYRSESDNIFHREKALREFMHYQQGTEYLIP